MVKEIVIFPDIYENPWGMRLEGFFLVIPRNFDIFSPTELFFI